MHDTVHKKPLVGKPHKFLLNDSKSWGLQDSTVHMLNKIAVSVVYRNRQFSRAGVYFRKVSLTVFRVQKMLNRSFTREFSQGMAYACICKYQSSRVL